MIHYISISLGDACNVYEKNNGDITKHESGIDEVGVHKRWKIENAWRENLWNEEPCSEVIFEDFFFMSKEAASVYFPMALLKIISFPKSINEFQAVWSTLATILKNVDSLCDENSQETIRSLSHTIYHMLKMDMFNIDQEDKDELEYILDPSTWAKLTHVNIRQADCEEK